VFYMELLCVEQLSSSLDLDPNCAISLLFSYLQKVRLCGFSLIIGGITEYNCVW
jgi:hypothetical protein